MANDAFSIKSKEQQSADEFALVAKLDGKIGVLSAYNVACLAILDGAEKSDWREQVEALQAVLYASKKALKQIDCVTPRLLDIYQARLITTAVQAEC